MPLRYPALPLGVVPLLGALLLSACDASGNGLRRGEFDARVVLAPDTTRGSRLEGDAVYTTLVDEFGRVRFVIALLRGDLYDNDEDDYAFVAFVRPGDAPGVGAFPVSSASDARTAFAGTFADVTDADRADEARGPVLTASDGVLTLTQVDDGLLRGQFRFTGVGLDLPDRRTLVEGAVSGVFEARAVSPETFRSLEVPLDLG